MADNPLPGDFASRFDGIPQEFVERMAEWTAKLKEALQAKGVDPGSVSSAMEEALKQGTGPLADPGAGVDPKMMEDLVSILRPEIEAELPSLKASMPKLEILRKEIRAAQEKTVAEMRGGIADMGGEVDPHMELALRALAGEDVEEEEPPPPPLDGLPPEVQAKIKELELQLGEDKPPKETMSLEQMKDVVDKVKNDVAASIAADLAAVGLTAGGAAAAAIVSGSPEDEVKAAQAMKEQLGLPETEMELPESEKPKASGQTSPEAMRDALKKMKGKARAELAATLEAMGQKDSPMLDILYPETPEAEKAAQEKMAQDMKAEQEKTGGAPLPNIG